MEASAVAERQASVPFDENAFFASINVAEEQWANSTLPIGQEIGKNAITDAIDTYDTIVLEAEPGSGKSTIAPALFLKQLVRKNSNAKIVVTQPRRLATESVATYVGNQIGNEFVDFRYRGHRLTKPNARLEFTVEQSLLNDLMADELLEQYDMVMIDEVHERSVNIDILLPLLKRAQEQRKAKDKKQLKLVFASATLDADALSKYFTGAHKLHIEGKPYNVTENYATVEVPADQIMQAAGDKAVELFADPTKSGDLLIFMPGKAEIEETIKVIGTRIAHAEIVTIMGGDQDGNPYEKINNNPGNNRRIYIATDAAETSITIPNITMVIDSGLMRKMIYDPDTRMTTLVTLPHTKANWRQRSRRAGRTQNGEAYALFTRKEWEDRREWQVAEFLQSDITPQILKMKAIGIRDVHAFNYIERPRKELIDQAIESLQKLGALDIEGNLTEMGRLMAKIDEYPHFSRMLIEGKKGQCLDAVTLLIAYMKTKESVFRYNPKRENFRIKYASYIDEQSDFITFLNVWNDYQTTFAEKNGKLSHEDFQKWQEKGINQRALIAVSKERKNLLRDSFFQDAVISTKDTAVLLNDDTKLAISFAIASGLIDKMMVKDSEGKYKFSNGTSSDMYIDSSSVFVGLSPEKVLTGKMHAKDGLSLMNMIFQESDLVKKFDYLRTFFTTEIKANTASESALSQKDEKTPIPTTISATSTEIRHELPERIVHSEDQSQVSFFREIKSAIKKVGNKIKNAYLRLWWKIKGLIFVST